MLIERAPTMPPSIMPNKKPEVKTTKLKNSTLGIWRIGIFKTIGSAVNTPILAIFLEEKVIF
jgi:hypothetical protein